MRLLSVYVVTNVSDDVLSGAHTFAFEMSPVLGMMPSSYGVGVVPVPIQQLPHSSVWFVGQQFCMSFVTSIFVLHNMFWTVLVDVVPHCTTSSWFRHIFLPSMSYDAVSPGHPDMMQDTLSVFLANHDNIVDVSWDFGFNMVFFVRSGSGAYSQ